jgi:Tol biopolymer transport system component
LFWEIAETTGMDLWALSLTDRKPISVLKTEFDERYAQFSPDGHWVAFQSNESGQDEIYIQPFEPGEKVPVSSGGGAQVRWNRNGRELFYLAPDRRLMSVSLSATAGGNGLQPSSPREVFPTRIWNTVTETTAKQEYVVSPDGKRFLMLVDPPESPAPPITVIMNWRGGSRP